MTIYADILMITNLYLDFFLLWCVKKALHLRVRRRRLVLGALCGSLCSLLSLLPGVSGWLGFLLGVVTAFLITWAAFAPGHLRTLLQAAAAFWIFSFLLAGFFLFLLQTVAPQNVQVLGTTVYIGLSPILLLLFTCLAYGCFALFHKLFPGQSSALRYARLLVQQDSNQTELFVKADTGNNLREPFSGLPVVIAEWSCFSSMLPPGLTPEGLSSEQLPPGFRVVPFESMGGAGILPAFRPTQVYLMPRKIPLDCYIALSPKKLSAGQFNALINPDFFPQISPEKMEVPRP